jgi:DNA-binding CsgD family transcriptional regulator
VIFTWTGSTHGPAFERCATGANYIAVVSTNLVERSEAISQLDEALKAAHAGNGNLVVVAGPAGIGKTALWHTVERLAAERGFAIRGASATELEVGFLYGLVRQLYRGPANSEVQPSETIAPILGRATGLNNVTDVSYQVLDGLYWLVGDMAAQTPLLLAVDDAQWADEPSLRHLCHLCRRLDGLRVVVLLTIRTGEPPRGVTDELTELASHRIEPAPLSVGGVGEMVQSVLGEPPSASFAQACRRQTGGYPLYLAELLRETRERGVHPDDAAIEELEYVDASGLAAHVWRRIETVGAGADSVVGLISILASRAEPWLVSRLSDLAAARVVEIVEALTTKGVLQTGLPLRFAHPIIRAAVHARLPSARLDTWHREAALLLDREGADVRDVAAHLMRCQPGGEPWAVVALRDSAHAVLGRGAPDAAAQQLRRALAEGSPPDERVALLRALARAEDAAGEPDVALGHFDDALRNAGDPTNMAEIAIAKAQTLSLLQRSGEALSALEAALEALDGADAELEQRIDAELIVQAFLMPGARERGLRRLARYEGRVPDGPAAQAVLSVMAVGALLGGGSAAEAASLAERALQAGGFRSAGFSAEVWTMATWVLIGADRPDLAQTVTESELPAARREGHRREIMVMEATLAFAAWRRGDLASAVSRAQAGLAVSDSGAHQAWCHGFTALALVEAGDIGATEEALAATAPPHWADDARGSNSLYHARALLHIEQGRLDEASSDLDQIRRRAEHTPVLSLGDYWRPVAVTVAHRRGDTHGARVLAAEILDDARRFSAAGILGPALRTAALVGEPSLQIEQLHESVELLAPSSCRLEHARSLVELGAALRRRGERTAAREPLTDGIEIAHRCGAAPLAALGLAELRATGARPRRPVRTGADSLTPAETRVASLAANGHSNREIAQELYVTLKTVEGTLGKAYAKLGISGRGARDALPQAISGLARES